MKRTIRILFGTALLLLNSCKDVIEINLSDEDVNLYAVEAKITTRDNPFVYVYKTQIVSSGENYKGIRGAAVTISDDSTPQKTIQLVENPETPGLYNPDENTVYKGETGKTYTITISTNGTVLTATDSLTKTETIDSIQIRPSLREEYRALGVFIYGKEPAGLGNYYKWDVYSNRKLINAGSGALAILNDKLINGNYIGGYEIYTDAYHQDKRKIHLGDSVQIKQTSISKFAYNYYYQIQIQKSNNEMYSVPPANIKSNFTASDGSTVVGLFTAHDVSSSNTVIIDEHIESQLKN